MSFFIMFANKSGEIRDGITLLSSLTIYKISPGENAEKKIEEMKRSCYPPNIVGNVIVCDVRGIQCYYDSREKKEIDKLLMFLRKMDISHHLKMLEEKQKSNKSLKMGVQLKLILDKIKEVHTDLEGVLETLQKEISSITINDQTDIDAEIEEIKKKYIKYRMSEFLRDLILLKQIKKIKDLLQDDISRLSSDEIEQKFNPMMGILIDDLLTPEAIDRERLEIEREQRQSSVHVTTLEQKKGQPDGFLVLMTPGAAKGAAKGAAVTGAASKSAPGAALKGSAAKGVAAKGSAKGAAAESDIKIDDIRFDEPGIVVDELINFLSRYGFSVDIIARKLSNEKYDEYETYDYALGIVKSIIDTANAVAPPTQIKRSELEKNLSQIQRKFQGIKSPRLTDKGIINLGNTCYLNALLQLLYRGLFKEIINLSGDDIKGIKGITVEQAEEQTEEQKAKKKKYK